MGPCITVALDRWQMDAQQERILVQATRDAHGALFNAPAGLSRAQRNALKSAYETAQHAEDCIGLGDDPYEEVGLLLCIAFVLLTRAASGSSGNEMLAQVAADIIDKLPHEFAADAIRGTELFPAVPTSANTPSARCAHAAAEALIAAAAVPFRGDQEWMACVRLIKEAGSLAHTAAQTHRR